MKDRIKECTGVKDEEQLADIEATMRHLSPNKAIEEMTVGEFQTKARLAAKALGYVKRFSSKGVQE